MNRISSSCPTLSFCCVIRELFCRYIGSVYQGAGIQAVNGFRSFLVSAYVDIDTCCVAAMCCSLVRSRAGILIDLVDTHPPSHTVCRSYTFPPSSPSSLPPCLPSTCLRS